MDILKIDNCVGLIVDLFGFKTMFISFLLMGNLLSYLIIWKTLIKRDTFFCEFYDNNNVYGEVQ